MTHIADKNYITGISHAVLGVLCFAPGAVFIKMAAGIDSIEITMHRMAAASFLIFLFSIFSANSIRALGRLELKELGLFGLVAAVHFGCFVASLSFTLVSHSLALCYTAPVFAALFSSVILSKRCGRVKMAGIAVTFAGILVLVGLEPKLNSSVLIGDALALVSGVALGLYQTLGGMYADRYSILKYKGNAYFFAALYLFLALMILRFWTGGFHSEYSAYSICGVVCSAVICTLIGHVFVNSALRRVDTVLVSLITTQEVTGGILFAMVFLGEMPAPVSLAGIVISLAGIALVIASKDHSNEKKQ